MRITPEDVSGRGVIYWADGTVRAEGRIMAHSLVPSVLIVTDDGDRIWWRHDMGEAVR